MNQRNPSALGRHGRGRAHDRYAALEGHTNDCHYTDHKRFELYQRQWSSIFYYCMIKILLDTIAFASVAKYSSSVRTLYSAIVTPNTLTLYSLVTQYIHVILLTRSCILFIIILRLNECRHSTKTVLTFYSVIYFLYNIVRSFSSFILIGPAHC